MDHVGAEIAEKLDFYTPITNFQMDQPLKLMSKMSVENAIYWILRS